MEKSFCHTTAWMQEFERRMEHLPRGAECTELAIRQHEMSPVSGCYFSLIYYKYLFCRQDAAAQEYFLRLAQRESSGRAVCGFLIDDTIRPDSRFSVPLCLCGKYN